MEIVKVLISSHREKLNTYMTNADVVRQATPREKWIGKVAQNLSWSRNIFSEMRVSILENSNTIQPEGKQLRKENEGS